MTQLATRAIVLHAFDYLESSRVVRLLTREAGLVSVLARGARRTRGGFSAGLDLFAEGEAQLSMRATRELQTLTGFEIATAHVPLALDLGRFSAASALAEVALRVAGGEPNAPFFDAIADGLTAIGEAGPGTPVVTATLAAAWRAVASAGFAPALALCAGCEAAVPDDAAALFSPEAGGVLCARCARASSAGRVLPPSARAALAGWVHPTASAADVASTFTSTAALRAHQRLLREFLTEHVTEERPLRAFALWEEMLGPRRAAPHDAVRARTTSAGGAGAGTADAEPWAAGEVASPKHTGGSQRDAAPNR